MKLSSNIVMLLAAASVASPIKVSAHCPLCTGGAGAAAIAAAYFGVRYGTLGVALGGFTTALSLWIANKIKKKYFKFQDQAVFWAIYLATILPFYFMFRGDYLYRYVSLGGEYGSITNRTYLIDLFPVGAVLGSLIVIFAPKISAQITKKRDGKKIPYQGLAINFILLLIAGIIIQWLPR